MEIAHVLNSCMMSNPHSKENNEIENVRLQVLNFFNASPSKYELVWTSNATGGLKIIGENFEWNSHSSFVYHLNSHNSVIGIREYAKRCGSKVSCVSNEDFQEHRLNLSKRGKNLIAFPGECNFSGRKFNVGKHCKHVRERKEECYTLVDAAALASSNAINVDEMDCDFLVVSFYKMFGLPSGLGALIIRKDSAQKCLTRKIFFGGGTVEASSASSVNFVRLRKKLSSRLEDGTIPFLSILSLKASFESMKKFFPSWSHIEEHCFTIAKSFFSKLHALKHFNGAPVAVVYGDWTENTKKEDNGPIIAFNLLKSDGRFVGYNEVRKLAELNNIMLRVGCFCNPGACEEFLGLTMDKTLENVRAGHICWDDKDVIKGVPTGAVRVSFGYCSLMRDAEEVIRFVETHFVDHAKENEDKAQHTNEMTNFGKKKCRLTEIHVYPIKSCRGFQVKEWIVDRGLLYDRSWVLYDRDSDRVMTQKNQPGMYEIFTEIENEKLVVRFRDFDPLIIDLKHEMFVEKPFEGFSGHFYNDEVNQWFRRALKKSGVYLVKKIQHVASFSNSSQFLVMSEQTLRHLNEKLKEKVTMNRFRPNLVISWEDSDESSLEDCVERIQTNGQTLINVGKCSRCEMICIDQESGERGKEPLKTLSKYRRENGQIMLGSFFEHAVKQSQVPYKLIEGQTLDCV